MSHRIDAFHVQSFIELLNFPFVAFYFVDTKRMNVNWHITKYPIKLKWETQIGINLNTSKTGGIWQIWNKFWVQLHFCGFIILSMLIFLCQETQFRTEISRKHLPHHQHCDIFFLFFKSTPGHNFAH